MLSLDKRKENDNVNGGIIKFNVETPLWSTATISKHIQRLGMAELSLVPGVDLNGLPAIVITSLFKKHTLSGGTYVFVLTPIFVGWTMWDSGEDEVLW